MSKGGDALAVMETMREKLKEYDTYTNGLLRERSQLQAKIAAQKHELKQLHRVIDQHVCGGAEMEAESSEESGEEDSAESS